MDPIIGGALIAGGSSLLGGFLGQERADQRADTAYERQLALEGTQIQRRVEDAKKAGIHPLYAMGGQVMGGAPMAVGDTLGGALAEGGQNVGNIMARQATAQERQRGQAEIALLESQKNETDQRAELAASQRALNNQALNATPAQPTTGVQSEFGPTGPMVKEGQTGGNPMGTGLVKVDPMSQATKKTGHPGVVAGEHAFTQEWEVVAGFPMMLPYSANEGPAETIEAMSVKDYAAFIAQNSRIYGPGWFDDFIRWQTGQRPIQSYKFQKDQPADKRPPTREESIRNKIERGWSGKGYPKQEIPIRPGQRG